MADNAQDPFILMRQDGSFAYLNKKALDTWGFTEEEAKYIKVPDVDPVYHHEAFNEPHLFAIARDITERKKAEEADDLKKSNVNLEEFAYAASHDLKEPIRKIHFFSERIKESMVNRMNENERHYFERLSGAAKRMNSLIDDLLSYSKISIHPRTFEEVNMNQLIDQVLEDLDLEIEHKKADVKVDHLFTIKGHHRQLQQAFLNLIGNALKYNKPGTSPVIKINSKEVDAADMEITLSLNENQQKYYCISVADNGIGF